jgi:hypothetical protein
MTEGCYPNLVVLVVLPALSSPLPTIPTLLGKKKKITPPLMEIRINNQNW